MSVATGAVAPAEPDRAEILLWGTCFAAVLALHTGLVAFLRVDHIPGSPGATDLPAIVMIDLAPVPAAMASPPIAEPEAATPGPVLEPEPPPVTVEAPAPLAVEPASPIDIPIPASRPQNAAVMLPAKSLPRPRPLPRLELPKKVAERTSPKPIRAAATPKRAEARDLRRPASEPAGAQRTASLPASSPANAVASAASAASWRSQLVGYLQANLRYPPGSPRGVAAVSFSLSRAGRVLSASIARSAGSPGLDAAALELFRRGQLPAPPADVAGATFSFTIPIRFNAR